MHDLKRLREQCEEIASKTRESVDRINADVEKDRTAAVGRHSEEFDWRLSPSFRVTSGFVERADSPLPLSRNEGQSL